MMTHIKPAAYRLSVMPSPVDPSEEQHASGLIVKREKDKENPTIRGVVNEVGGDWGDDWKIEAGDAVYYKEYDAIGEIHIVRHGNVIAFEKSDVPAN